jgi:hypothetical protein
LGVHRFLYAGFAVFAATTFSLLAAAPAITASNPLPPATYGEAYEYDVVIDPMPWKWGAVALPGGLSFNPTSSQTTYRLSGTPTRSGTFDVEFFAEDMEGNETRVTRRIVIEPPDDSEPPTMEITSMAVTPLPGENYYRFLFTFAAADNLGVANLEFRGGVGHGPLDDWKYYPYLPGEPMEIILHCTAFEFEVRAVDVAGNRSSAANRKFEAPPGVPVVSTPQGGSSLPQASGSVGKKFTYRIKVKGATRFTASGLPPGCKLDWKTGVIKGTPKKPGTYSVKITASGAGGSLKTKLKIRISR